MLLQRGTAQNLIQHLLLRGLRKRLECLQELLSGGDHDLTLHLL